ncbi:MAG: DNA translocase FtsK [Phycisphaerales bacterium]|nr:DNA translocase FtsK [Phycisphaerales bacterium]
MAKSSKKTTKKSKSSRPYRVKDQGYEPTEQQILVARIGWLALGAIWVFVLAGLVSFDAGDSPSHAVWPNNANTQNWTGPIGAHISYGLLRTFGIGVAIPMLFTGVLLTLRVIRRPMTQPIIRGLGAFILTTSLCVLLGVLFPKAGPLPGMVGGTLGLVGANLLLPSFAMAGSLVWILLATIVGLLVCCDKYVWLVPIAIWNKLLPALSVTGAKASEIAGNTAIRANASADRASENSRLVGRKASGGVLSGLKGMMSKKPKPVLVRVNDIDEEMVEVKPIPTDEEVEARRRAKPKRTVKPVPQPIEDEVEDEDGPGAPQVFSQEDLREKIAKLPVRFAQANKELATDEDLAEFQDVQSLEGYKFPRMDLLVEPEVGFNEKLETLVRDQAEALEHALQQYKINGEVVDIESGPAITLYHIRLAPGTKVSQINAIESDLARALKAVNIRVVANMIGRDTIGIEVPNPTKERVRLKELMANRALFEDMKLPMFLGKDAAGEPLISDLTKMPHMLIAGTTGSGKSVCMNTIIMSFLYTKKPNELKLVLVDPKMVEMSQFKDIPHLMCPVVTEMPKAAAILEWAVTKMDERYELLAKAGCRDIAGYNELEWDELKERLEIQTEEQAARVPKQLPYMVFIIDELADLMMTTKEVEGAIIRIAQKARAVGIHLILATQRPQANVVTGLIKSNMPCRIAFKVASGMDSRIVLDQKGGELLLGQGDMLHLSPSSHELSRAQGTLVDDKEIRKVVKFLKEIAAPSFERSLMQVKGGMDSDEERVFLSENNSSASLKAAEEDPMFDRAVEIVLETKRGSVSLLQRRLAIGYTRASRLIDLMGIAGILSDHKGSVARDVLISIDEWDAMKDLVAEDARQAQLTDPEDPHQEMMFETDSESEETDVIEEAPFDDDESAAVEVLGTIVDDDIEQEVDVDEEEEELDPEDEYEEDSVDEEEEDYEDEYEVENESEDDLEDEDEDGEEVDEVEDELEEEEEEVEYEYVDEDGNPIDPEDLEEDEYEVDGEDEDSDEDEEYEVDEYEDEELEEEEASEETVV